MDFKLLTPSDFDEVRIALKAAFSTYSIQLDTSEKALFERFTRVNVSYPHSGAFYEGNKMVGFILHGIGERNGKKVAYNAGTGVIPEFRGQQLTEKMYANLIDMLIKNNFSEIVLEVIDTNESAVKIYDKIGFKKTRLLNCYIQNDDFEMGNKKTNDLDTMIVPTNFPNDLISDFLVKNADCIPSWQNDLHQIKNNKGEKAFLSYLGDSLVGIIMLNVNSGRVSSICVDRKFRRKGLATQLLLHAQLQSYPQLLSFINVDNAASDLNLFLKRQHFDIFVKQEEMKITI